ncbi:SDR family NAD(P)-dependent oxidoreductase [Streptomyces sp. VNUA24]|uniref:SDR family NAD(P)-dependent oxidoreductase n=1 Tax=Streptomyces sp. VNUA24 TaxID=3031131 RepID=UPI0023B80447|nr:SDR family NAD(P)-dependent oxidoreductase [Streptomyces sp. VNUA24]WEH12842.1 SDR family NAD(P)-dependent oxidoreductase [Streptomyces sp. VNUA24]
MNPGTDAGRRPDTPVAVVTGGATGIGFAVAEALAGRGYDVVVAGRRAETLTEAVEQLRTTVPGARVTGVPTDVGAPADVDALFARVEAEYGRIDALVTAAAALHVAPFDELTPSDWHSMIDVVVNGAALSCMHATRLMKARGDGRIVLIGSVSGMVSDAGLAHYNAAKAAVHSLARSLAVDLAPYGITANAIAPGWIRTPMISDFVDTVDAEWLRHMNPMSRAAEPAEVADVVRYLVTEAPTFLTGATIAVDGGQTAMNHYH